MNERVVDIVEDYLQKNFSGEQIKESDLERRIRRCRVPEDQIHELIVEIKDEFNREKNHRVKLKNAKQSIFMGILIALGFMTLSIVSSMGYLFGGYIPMFTYGAIAVAFVTSGQSYMYIRKSKSVKQRREIKYGVYDKY